MGWRGGPGCGGRRKPPDRPSRWRLCVRALAKQCFASKAPSPLGAWPRHPCRGHPRNRTHPAFDGFRLLLVGVDFLLLLVGVDFLLLLVGVDLGRHCRSTPCVDNGNRMLHEMKKPAGIRRAFCFQRWRGTQVQPSNSNSFRIR
ncbi:hypothetical protein BN1263170140 [Stenotrophomonas indicatrix]|nr:hypothetical protein BN1263170140 [Stenotrophomonas indicatrix]